MKRILVCGGRNFGHVNLSQGYPASSDRMEEYRYIHAELNNLITNLSINLDPNDNWLPTDITIISGGANGVDKAAADFAVVNFCQLEVYPADWHTYGKSAGYIRNKQMLDEGKPDLVVAFPGGKGTAMMVDLATKAGVKVINMMGTLGFGSQEIIDGSTYSNDSAEKLKTERFIKLYFQRIAELGSIGPVLKSTLMQEVIKQEREWLESMGSEYDEIISAQEAYDKIQT